MGEVYEAEERAPRRNVALKVLLPDLAGHPHLTQRFEREIQAMASVEHEHVVPIYAQGEVDGTSFFTMRLIAGTSLDKLLGRRDFRREDLLTVLDGAAAGLDACHAKDVVHRDVKPPNIMVERGTRRGLVADFGIARAADFSTLTVPGAVIGTLTYMAPEALRGEGSTARSDVFSLGCVAYVGLTGKLPRAAAVPDAAVVPPRERDARLPAAVDDVLLRALADDPRDRHGSAQALVADLRDAVQPAAQEPSVKPRPMPKRTLPTKPFVRPPRVPEPARRARSEPDTASVPHGPLVAALAVAVFVLTPILILVIRQLVN